MKFIYIYLNLFAVLFSANWRQMMQHRKTQLSSTRNTFVRSLMLISLPKARRALLVICAGMLLACSRPAEGWSEIQAWANGQGKSIGTLGLGLSLGASGKIQFAFGPYGSMSGPATPDVKKDAERIGLATGSWTLEKGDTKIVLPRDSDGATKMIGYYENVDSEVWDLLSSPGCSSLRTAIDTSLTSSGPLIQRTYKYCGVAEAAAALKR